MTIVHTLDKVAEWLQQNVCAHVSLKPHAFDDQTDDYNMELVHPTVFSLYTPTKRTKPPGVKATIPSICVQLVDGTDEVFKRDRTLKLHLSFSAWDPGIHTQDVFEPTDGESEIGTAYKRGKKKKLQLSHEGWRDVWNFVDVALRAIETPRSLGGYQLDPKTPIQFGVYDEEGSISDYYPFWFAWVELAITQEIIVAEPAYGDLL